MTDILDLEGWKVLGRVEENGEDVLEAEYPYTTPKGCLKCATLGTVYRHGTKVTTYVDIPIRGKPAKLRATVQRYRCTSCRETFLQPLGGILEGRRMTERCATYIKARSLQDTFTRIAQDVGCDDKTVRTLGAEYMAELEASFRPYMPDWLGLDDGLALAADPPSPAVLPKLSGDQDPAGRDCLPHRPENGHASQGSAPSQQTRATGGHQR